MLFSRTLLLAVTAAAAACAPRLPAPRIPGDLPPGAALFGETRSGRAFDVCLADAGAIYGLVAAGSGELAVVRFDAAGQVVWARALSGQAGKPLEYQRLDCSAAGVAVHIGRLEPGPCSADRPDSAVRVATWAPDGRPGPGAFLATPGAFTNVYGVAWSSDGHLWVGGMVKPCGAQSRPLLALIDSTGRVTEVPVRVEGASHVWGLGALGDGLVILGERPGERFLAALRADGAVRWVRPTPPIYMETLETSTDEAIVICGTALGALEGRRSLLVTAMDAEGRVTWTHEVPGRDAGLFGRCAVPRRARPGVVAVASRSRVAGGKQLDEKDVALVPVTARGLGEPLAAFVDIGTVSPDVHLSSSPETAFVVMRPGSEAGKLPLPYVLRIPLEGRGP